MEIKWKETELKQKAGNLVKKVLKRDEIFLLPGILGTVLGLSLIHI